MVLNKGMRYINGYMDSYVKNKRGISYVYHKYIICAEGVITKSLNI